jgi:uncharacterized protein (TIGR02452 family)
MAGRKSLGEVARETLALLNRGEYVAPGGRRVAIREALDQARALNIHYTPAALDELVRRREEVLRGRPRAGAAFEVVNCSTLATTRNLSDLDKGAGVLALNFASAKRPGGGFLDGGRSQEESLARASGLYPGLAAFPRLYETNQACASALYTDHMIYSPAVPVFRDDEGELLGQPYPVSFLTAPAVNVAALKPAELPRVEATMRARMDKLLTVAAVHGHTTLVLGAWGCGAFGNDPAHVAALFHEHLQGPVFAGLFRQVVFAILDWSPDRRVIEPFERQFAPEGRPADCRSQGRVQ